MGDPATSPDRAAGIRRAHAVAARAERATLDARGPAEDRTLVAEVDRARDVLRDALSPSTTVPGGEIADACDALVRLTGARGRLREHALELRFRSLERIHDALGRLGTLQTVGELLPAAAEELARACGFDRTVISRRRGATWRAEAVWTAPELDPEVSAATVRYLRETWIPIGPKALEADLVRRRTADLVAAGDPRTTQELMDVSRSAGYVAAPVMPTGRVIGFLQADRGDRGVTELDRDNLWTFAEGFGLVFERVTLLERLEAQRERARSALQAAERGLAGLSVTERALRRDGTRDPASPGSAAGEVADGRGPAPGDAQDPRPPGPSSRSSAPGSRSPTSAGPTAPAAADVLTAREREVLELMATGAQYREIAARLTVGETTVKSHVHAILRKLGAVSRADAVSRHLRGTVTGGD